METTLVLICALACPLMMLAMGGMAWAGAKSRGDHAGKGDPDARQ